MHDQLEGSRSVPAGSAANIPASVTAVTATLTMHLFPADSAYQQPGQRKSRVPRDSGERVGAASLLIVIGDAPVDCIIGPIPQVIADQAQMLHVPRPNIIRVGIALLFGLP